MKRSSDAGRKHIIKPLSIILACYMAFVLVFYWASGDQLFYCLKETKPITAKSCTVAITDQTEVAFSFTPEMDTITNISVLIGTNGRDNQGELLIGLYDQTDSLLAQSRLLNAELKDYSFQNLDFGTEIGNVRGKELTLRVSAEGVPEGQGVSLWYGNTLTTGKFEIPDMNNSMFFVDGAAQEGKICYSLEGKDSVWIGHWYWQLAGLGAAALLCYALWYFHCENAGRETLLHKAKAMADRYFFLIKQLVSRDFKRKYKRSALGVCWSFLNPLLTMMVQYLVFSTIFKSSIENFIIYLLSGIIMFNFFGEAVGLGLSSVVDNAHLINKVYLPKMIFPLSRVLSSVINLLMSLIPLFIMMILTRVPITKAVLLLPIGLICLLLFSMGFAMMLSASMVFFRDTLFLWNIISTLWQYLTPTFYPVDIIPAALLPIYKLNPMYQFITFARSILMEGTAPEPGLYFGCIASAVVMFVIGYMVFRKNQDKFILYL